MTRAEHSAMWIARFSEAGNQGAIDVMLGLAQMPAHTTDAEIHADKHDHVRQHRESNPFNPLRLSSPNPYSEQEP